MINVGVSGPGVVKHAIERYVAKGFEEFVRQSRRLHLRLHE